VVIITPNRDGSDGRLQPSPDLWSNNVMRHVGILISLFLSSLLSASRLSAETIWLEAEQFEQPGGWLNDPQFIAQMGSPYLLAVGLGKPVDDAKTRLTVKEPGEYRLWVRAKDWVPEHHPGRFQVLLNGKAATEAFGATGKKGWVWEDGGVHQLGQRV